MHDHFAVTPKDAMAWQIGNGLNGMQTTTPPLTSHRKQAAALFRDTRKSRGHSTLCSVPCPLLLASSLFLSWPPPPPLLGRPLEPIIPRQVCSDGLLLRLRSRRPPPPPPPPVLGAVLRFLLRAPQPRSRGADRHQGRAGRPARRAEQLGPILRRPLQLGHDHLLRQEPRHWPGSTEPGAVRDSVREDRQPHPSRASVASEQQHHGPAAAAARRATAARDAGPLQQPLLRPRARHAGPPLRPPLPAAKQQQPVRCVPRVAGQAPAARLPGPVLQQPHWACSGLPRANLQHRGQPDDLREQWQRGGVRRRTRAGQRAVPAGIHSGQQQDDRPVVGDQVKGWLRASADRRGDKPWRLLPRALRRVLLPLAAKAPALLGPFRSRHPRARRRSGRGRWWRGGAAGQPSPVRAARASRGHGRVQPEEHPRERRVRERVPRPARRRHHGGREAAQGPGQRVGRGPVPNRGGDDQPRRAPPPAPPRRVLRRLRGAHPRLPLHAQRQRRGAPAREAGAGLVDAEAHRGGRRARAAVPARAVRPEDHPPGREGSQRAAGRAPRGRRGRLRARQAAGPRRLARHHGGARHRGTHRARVPLHGAVVGEDGRLRVRDPAAGARHGAARARGRQGLRRGRAGTEGRHAGLGEKGAPREDARPAGGPGPGPLLRPHRGGGDGAGGAPLHPVPAVAPAQDVRGGQDAGGRRPRREMGGHQPPRIGSTGTRRARLLRPPERLQRLRVLQRFLPRQRQQPEQRRGAVHRHGGGDGAVGTKVVADDGAVRNKFIVQRISLLGKITGSKGIGFVASS